MIDYFQKENSNCNQPVLKVLPIIIYTNLNVFKSINSQLYQLRTIKIYFVETESEAQKNNFIKDSNSKLQLLFFSLFPIEMRKGEKPLETILTRYLKNEHYVMKAL